MEQDFTNKTITNFFREKCYNFVKEHSRIDEATITISKNTVKIDMISWSDDNESSIYFGINHINKETLKIIMYHMYKLNLIISESTISLDKQIGDLTYDVTQKFKFIQALQSGCV